MDSLYGTLDFEEEVLHRVEDDLFTNTAHGINVSYMVICTNISVGIIDCHMFGLNFLAYRLTGFRSRTSSKKYMWIYLKIFHYHNAGRCGSNMMTYRRTFHLPPAIIFMQYSGKDGQVEGSNPLVTTVARINSLRLLLWGYMGKNESLVGLEEYIFVLVLTQLKLFSIPWNVCMKICLTVTFWKTDNWVAT